MKRFEESDGQQSFFGMAADRLRGSGFIRAALIVLVVLCSSGGSSGAGMLAEEFVPGFRFCGSDVLCDDAEYSITVTRESDCLNDFTVVGSIVPRVENSKVIIEGIIDDGDGREICVYVELVACDPDCEGNEVGLGGWCPAIFPDSMGNCTDNCRDINGNIDSAQLVPLTSASLQSFSGVVSFCCLQLIDGENPSVFTGCSCGSCSTTTISGQLVQTCDPCNELANDFKDSFQLGPGECPTVLDLCPTTGYNFGDLLNDFDCLGCLDPVGVGQAIAALVEGCDDAQKCQLITCFDAIESWFTREEQHIVWETAGLLGCFLFESEPSEAGGTSGGGGRNGGGGLGGGGGGTGCATGDCEGMGLGIGAGEPAPPAMLDCPQGDGNDQATSDPVHHATGDKAEVQTDIRVALRGTDFNLTRSYRSASRSASSEPLEELPSPWRGYLGENWNFSSMPFIDSYGDWAEIEDLPEQIRLVKPGYGSYFFNKLESSTSSAATYQPVGNADETIRIYHEQNDPQLPLVIILSDSSQRHHEFNNLSGQRHVMIQRDAFNNVVAFEWGSVDGAQRPMAAYLNGEIEAEAEAKIDFEWWDSTTWSAGSGLLKRATVLRRGSTASFDEVTQTVEYGYVHSVDPTSGETDVIFPLPAPSAAPAFTTASHTDLGSMKDLVQVTTATRTNVVDGTGDPRFHRRVVQYRYFGGSTTSGVASVMQDGISAVGAVGHLKMEILPEAIEYSAQVAATTATDLSVYNHALEILKAEDYAMSGTGIAGSGFWPSELASKIVSYALNNAQTAGPVRHQWLRSDCGCGPGGGDAFIRERFDRLAWDESTGNPGMSVRIAHEELGTATSWAGTLAEIRAITIDTEYLGGHLGTPSRVVNKVLEDPASGVRWVTHYTYNDQYLVEKKAWPSTTQAYQSMFDTGGPIDRPVYTPRPSGGLVEIYEYAFTRHTETWVSDTLSPSSGNKDIRTKKSYAFQRVTATERHSAYGTGGGANDDIEVTEYTYGTFNLSSAPGQSNLTTPDVVAWMRVRVEAEAPTENGPASGTTYDAYEFFNTDGDNVWSISPDGGVTYRAYDATHGAMTAMVQLDALPTAADPNGLFPAFDVDYYNDDDGDEVLLDSQWPQSASPIVIATHYEHDLLGRVIKQTDQGGTETYMLRDLAEDSERPGIYYMRSVTLPHMLDGGTGPMDPPEPIDFAGPARVNWMNAAGRTIRSSSFEIEPATGFVSADYGSADQTESFEVGLEIARSAAEFTAHGTMLGSKRWPELDLDRNGSVDPSPEFYETTYKYDILGRRIETTLPNDSVTRNQFDVLGRLVSTEVGTVSAGTEPVADYYYDGNSSVDPTVPVSGNGYLTRIEAYVNDDSLPDRITLRTYDSRGRLLTVQNPDAPHEAYSYDNLDRVVEQAIYSSIVGVTPENGLLTDTTNRGTYSTTEYSQRGLPFRQQVMINPASSLLSDNALTTNTWFDANGRTLTSRGPNGPTQKMVYDRLGRTTTSYTIADLPHATDYTKAAGLDATVDRVLQQTAYEYDAESRLDLVTSLAALHTSDTPGELLYTTGIPSYTRFAYDEADRRIASIGYGTNATEDRYESGAAAPTSLPSSFASLDPNNPVSLESAVNAAKAAGNAWAVEIMKYNTRGMVEDVIRPRGDTSPSGDLASKTLVTRMVYDDLARRIAVIENAEAATEASIIWLTGGAYDRWSLDLMSVPDADTDRVTSYVFDSLDRIVYQTAHTEAGSMGSGEEFQATQYVYGVSPSDTPAASAFTNADLLREVIYPDESSGLPGSGNAYKVRYGYNRLGELTGMIDQNGTAHVYDRDDRGRMIKDAVTAFGTDIDQAVKAIVMDYDAFGRLEVAESTDGAGSPTVLNSVSFGYTPLWQVASVVQDNDGDGSRAAETVSYSYTPNSPGDSHEASTRNTSRLVGVQYPGDTSDTLVYGYGANDSINELTSRIASIDESGVDLVEYAYAGVGMPVIVDYPMIDVELARDLTPYDAGSPSTTNAPYGTGYPTLDRHGRILRHAWISHTDGDGQSASRTNYTGSAVDRRYAYDILSNRTANQDGRGSHLLDLDWTYEYDGLNRLSEANRGKFGSGGFVAARGSQSWDLDVLGNWELHHEDGAGDGLAAYSGGDLRDTRSHNSANEISNQSNAVYQSGVGWATTLPKVPQFDPAGNMRSDAQTGTTDGFDPSVYTYDAWNRLVKAERDVDFDQVYTVGRYEYNALNWRTRKRADTSDSGPDGHLDQQRWFYWSASWQLLEEHVENDVDADGTYGDAVNDTVYKSRQFWGTRYIDDSVAKRIDRTDDGFSTSDDRYFYLTDAQFSVVALLDEDQTSPGGVVERIDYTPYGVARHRSAVDTRTTLLPSGTEDYPDGVLDLSDVNFFTQGGFSGNEAETDLAHPFGVWDLKDSNQFSVFNDGNTAPEGWLSRPGLAGTVGTDNSIGYAGYCFDLETASYSQRFRQYKPELGLWLTRDPASYVDGTNLYQYGRSSPVRYTDWNGRAASEPQSQSTKPKYPAWDDPSKGCGITVRQQNLTDLGEYVKRAGNKRKHRWINIPTGPNSSKTAGYGQGIGNPGCWSSPDPYAPSGNSPFDSEFSTRPGGEAIHTTVDYVSRMVDDDGYITSTHTIKVDLPLKYGSGADAGKTSSNATCDEIRECINAALKKYSCESGFDGGYNPLFGKHCRNPAGDPLAECGITSKFNRLQIAYNKFSINE